MLKELMRAALVTRRSSCFNSFSGTPSMSVMLSPSLSLPLKHIILCSDVEVSDDEDRVTKDYLLEDLLK